MPADPQSPLDERRDVVILGAGVAGLTAAHRLRDHDVAVLEAEPRVGGRTLSGGDDDAWFNIGAQLISSRRMVELCRELGIDLVSASEADFGFAVNGRFARGATPARLLSRMRLSPAQKLDFAVASLRLRRRLHAIEHMSSEQRAELDEKTLLDVIGRVSPSTLHLFAACCDSASGLGLSSISALYGLAYALGAYLDPATKQDLYGVRGGTQRVAIAIAAALPEGVVRLSSTITSVRRDAAGDVVVRYRGPEGGERTVTARHCICALPAHAVLKVVEDLPATKRAALHSVTPYGTAISVAWPVPDGMSAPWDGVFVAPAAGLSGFNIITNYGYLARQRRPELGGYLNTLASGVRADALAEVDDERVLQIQHAELVRLFPTAAPRLDPAQAVVQRWTNAGLPPMRPGYLGRRAALRAGEGNIHFCGDYTSEPGLPGANGSGHHAGEAVARALGAPTPA